MTNQNTQIDIDCSHLGKLLFELGNHVYLEQKEYQQIFNIWKELEKEFGDLQKNLEKIHQEFLNLYKKAKNQIHKDSITKVKSIKKRRIRRLFRSNKDLIRRIIDEKREEGEEISQEFCDNVWEKLFANLGEIQNGGVKSFESCYESSKDLNELDDVMRARFVAKDLKTLEHAFQLLSSEFEESSLVVRIKNGFNQLFEDKHAKEVFKPYLAINVKIAVYGVPYELQMMTENAAIIGKLDHPVRVRRKVDLSTESARFLEALSWGSHLLDYRKYLNA